MAELRSSVLDRLRTLVFEGELRPGDRLVERQLAERLGVSRVPVREALHQLLHEGLAEERPTRGMVVRRLTDADVDALFEVRGALEELVCRRVVEHATDEALDRLDAVVDAAGAAVRRGDPGGARELNAEFHSVLVELAGPVLVDVMGPVAGRLRALLTQHDDPAVMQRDHVRIAAALRRRDLDDAAERCREHLLSSRAAVDAKVGP